MDKILSYVGLALRGRNCVSGEFSVEQAVKEKKAFLVIIASDASDNTKKKFQDMCGDRQIPVLIYAQKASLGQALGQEERAVAAILSEGLATAIRSIKLDED